MSLAPSERRALGRIEDSLSRSDPRLATMLATFTLTPFCGNTPRLASVLRRITLTKRLMLAVTTLAALAVIMISALLHSSRADPLCSPAARVAGGQTLSCPPAAGPRAPLRCPLSGPRYQRAER
jgi:hypothetical protein